MNVKLIKNCVLVKMAVLATILLICLKIFKTIIFLIVFYRCETLSLALREAHGLRVFVNKVLRRIFVPKMDKMT